MNYLFICSQNKLRSPTAEKIFDRRNEISTRSAGTDKKSENPLSYDDVEWADLIFVMEIRHKRILIEKFGKYLKDKKVFVLNIPDNYDYMDDDLVKILEEKMERHL